jgi:hypothetical protein
MIHDALWATKGIATVYMLSSRIHYLVTSGTNRYIFLWPFRFSAFLGGFSMSKGKQIIKESLEGSYQDQVSPMTAA